MLNMVKKNNCSGPNSPLKARNKRNKDAKKKCDRKSTNTHKFNTVKRVNIEKRLWAL